MMDCEGAPRGCFLYSQKGTPAARIKGEAETKVEESGGRMSSLGQGWPGENHKTKKGWFSSICKALKLTRSLQFPQGPQAPCLPF